jgi:competence ComEA-like helix-hairpin-helix protein
MQSQFAHVLIFFVVTALIACAEDSELPEGKGKDAVESTCTECHTLRRIKIQRLDEEGWDSVLREMTENGADINPDDLTIIAEYLTKNFGPDRKVNINKAEADEIATTLRLTSAEANLIVQYRIRNGSFKDLSTIEKVSGAADKIEARKALIEF